MKAAGFDVGTTGLKGMIVDQAGAILAETTIPYQPSSPRPGWSEQDPEDWWRAFQACARALAGQAGTPDAIGLSGQMHGSVFLDHDGRSISPAILWNDQRTSAECDEIWNRTDGQVVEWTLNEPRTAFTASKILWLCNNHPSKFERLASVLLPKDFIRYRLSGELISDVTDASGTNLLDVRARRWSEPMLKSLGIDHGLMPALAESAALAGTTHAPGADAAGLAPGTPIVGGGADQACAAIGNGIVRAGALSITLGTSGVVYAQLPAIVTDPTGAFHTFCHAVPETWMVMAGVLSAGGSFQWYRDTVGAADAERSIAAGRSAFEGIVEEAERVGPGSGGLVFLPYLTGERSPHNDPRARGAWLGLTSRHGRAHMARAVVEGVCFALRDLVETVEKIGVEITEIRIAGGGARGAIWLQTLSDVIERPVAATTTPDASAYGAAILAMSHALGSPVASIADAWVKVERPVEPDLKAARIYDEVYAVFRSLYPANREAMHRLSAIDLMTAEEKVA